MEHTQSDVIDALVKMTGRPAYRVAAECGLSHTNFSAALKGARPFPKTRLPVLQKLLGLDGDFLDTRRVHFWQVGNDLAPLKSVMEFLLPEGARMEGLWREGKGIWDLKRALDNVMFAVSDGKHRIIIKRSGIRFLLNFNPDPITPETIPGLTWRTDPPSAESMLQIPEDRYAYWERGEISIEEFDSIWKPGGASINTWETIKSFATANGMSVDDVLQLLKSATSNRT